MKTWVRRSLNAGALTAGALLAAGGPAHADVVALSADNSGILNGTQALTPVKLPVTVAGNAVAVAGAAHGASSLDASWSYDRYREDVAYQGRHHMAATTESTGGPVAPRPAAPRPAAPKPAAPKHAKPPAKHPPAKHTKPPKPAHGHHDRTTMISKDNAGVLNGNQVYAPVQVPINICGNAIGVLGGADA